MIPNGTGLCFVVNQYRSPVATIATLIFEGETDNDVRKKLDQALATLPFRTLYSYVISGNGSIFQSLFKKVQIIKIVDSPGAEVVIISLEVECQSGYFLPRDPKTREFVGIHKQVKCLEALRVVHREGA